MDLFRSPAFNRQVACVADDARLAATIASLVGEEGEYVSVLHGPRMARPDNDSEVIRRCNAIAKIWPKMVLLAALDEDAEAGVRAILPKGIVFSVRDLDEALTKLEPVKRADLKGEIRCRAADVGPGLLRAKREKKLLVVDDTATPLHDPAENSADHLVVLDDHDPIAQIIAANYAYSIGADLVLIPERNDTLREQVYARLDQRVAFRGQARGQRAQKSLQAMRDTLEPALKFGPRKFVTFITKGIPYGYFYREAPSTHLFSQPHLGEMINAGIYWSTEEPFTCAAVLIDPGHFHDSETSVVAHTLESEGVVVLKLLDEKANVENTRLFIQAFPYDLLFICSHCGEVAGERLTVRVPDGQGVLHLIEIDQALQFGSMAFSSKPGKLVQVHQLIRPVSIDGIDWHSAGSTLKQHYVSIWEYLLHTPLERWQIVQREEMKHVSHSTAIQLKRGALMLSFVQVIDARVSPIIFNNSCVSFYDAAHTLTFAGARSYVGTLAPVQDADARRLADTIFTSGERKWSLPLALAKTQEQVFSDPDERTYVHIGCHFNAIRTLKTVASIILRRRVVEAKTHWLSRVNDVDSDMKDNILEIVRFLSVFA